MTELPRLETLDPHHRQVELPAQFGVHNQVLNLRFRAGLAEKGL